MDTRYLRKRYAKNRSGWVLFVVLALVVAVLMVMVLLMPHYTGADALDPFTAFSGSEMDRYADPNAYPWEEGRLFVRKHLDGYNMGGRRPPFRVQPKIDHMICYRSEVYDGNKQRGQVILTIFKKGDAISIWTGDFKIKGNRYTIVEKEGVNKFEGNIAPLKIYKDENGKDRSKLYVITEGFFHLQKSGEEDKSLTGFAYITAWIDRDYNAEGKLWIQSFVNGELAVFDWGPVSPSEE